MKTRKVEFVGNIPVGHIDLFAKIINNICGEKGLQQLHISSGDLIISLQQDHVEAIANEAATYIELENSVRKASHK